MKTTHAHEQDLNLRPEGLRPERSALDQLRHRVSFVRSFIAALSPDKDWIYPNVQNSNERPFGD